MAPKRKLSQAKKKASRRHVRPRGQADPLLGGSWKQWVQHLSAVGPSWVAVALISVACGVG